MNSELGMLLPFAFVMFVMFVVWSGTRIILARSHARKGDAVENAQIAELTARVDYLEQSLDATTSELQRLTDAERFTTQLLAKRTASSLDPTNAQAAQPG